MSVQGDYFKCEKLRAVLSKGTCSKNRAEKYYACHGCANPGKGESVDMKSHIQEHPAVHYVSNASRVVPRRC